MKTDRESEKKLDKNSPLSPAIQNRVFFFCFDLLTILEKNNTGGIQRSNEWRRWGGGGGHSSSLLTDCEPFAYPGKISVCLCRCWSLSYGSVMLWGSEQSGGQMSAFASTSAELAGSGGEVPPSGMWGRDGHSTQQHWSQQAALSTASKASFAQDSRKQTDLIPLVWHSKCK